MRINHHVKLSYVVLVLTLCFFIGTEEDKVTKGFEMVILLTVFFIDWIIQQINNKIDGRTQKRPIRLFLDCEFNGGKGVLISMALVAEDGREFYEVISRGVLCEEWVFYNVIPVLNKTPIEIDEFSAKLASFLCDIRHFEVIANHPADLSYFADAIISDTEGTHPRLNFTMRHYYIKSTSKIPHNALEDARGLRDAYMADKQFLALYD